MDVRDKVVVITGGGSGMGAKTAAHLAEQGAKVAVLDINGEAATQVASSIQGLPIECDVLNEPQLVEALIQVQDRLGPPYVCVNCAGIAPAKRMIGREGPMPLHDFQHVINVNLIGTFNMLRLICAHMVNNKPVGSDNERGVLVNTASIAAFEGQIGQSAYSASKAGICGLTLPLARELAQFGIRVVTIAPGLIKTPLFDDFPQEVQNSLASGIPFPKRLGNPLEYAWLVAHIIQNPYINGEIIRLDAGLRMQAK